MLRISITVVVFVLPLSGLAVQGQNSRVVSSHYLFVWAGDADRKESDFLAVIDVRPHSKRYGQIITTLPIGSAKNYPHHTEHEMPLGGIRCHHEPNIRYGDADVSATPSSSRRKPLTGGAVEQTLYASRGSVLLKMLC